MGQVCDAKLASTETVLAVFTGQDKAPLAYSKVPPWQAATQAETWVRKDLQVIKHLAALSILCTSSIWAATPSNVYILSGPGIAVLNWKTLEPVTTIPFHVFSAHTVAANPNGKYVYIPACYSAEYKLACTSAVYRSSIRQRTRSCMLFRRA